MSKIQFWFDPKYPNAKLPEFGSKLASGMDLFAAEDFELQGFELVASDASSPGSIPMVDPFATANKKWLSIKTPEPKIIHTGIWLAGLEKDHELQIRSRSGNTLKCSFFVGNQPGTIDADYLGPMNVILVYIGAGKYPIKKGQKIAQVVESMVIRSEIEKVPEITRKTERGDKGFGSTG